MAKAAVGQICSSASMAHNLEQCVNLVSRAAAAGAKILFLPEASDYIAPSAQESLRLARPVAQSQFVAGLRSAAAEHQLAVHVGIHVPVPSSNDNKNNKYGNTTPIPEPDSSQQEQVQQEHVSPEEEAARTTPTQTKLYNRTILITPTGALLHPAGTYDKIHLFDYPRGNLRESASTRPGAALTPPFPSPVGRLGSLICFDLRFPEPALALARPSAGPSSRSWRGEPAQVLLYPSAFTVPTGRAHWEVLLRARAIETGSWVVAAAQVGRHPLPPSSPSPSSASPDTTTTTITTTTAEGGRGEERGKRVSYGHSMVVDPWGKVVLELKGVSTGGGDDEDDPEAWEAEDGAVGQLGVVDIDLGLWERVRERMPLRRRTDVYPQI